MSARLMGTLARVLGTFKEAAKMEPAYLQSYLFNPKYIKL
jgi:hypothetical protein